MARVFFSVLVLVLATLQAGRGDSLLRIDIKPNSTLDATTVAVHLSCIPEVNNNQTNGILILELTDDRKENLALVRPGQDSVVGSTRKNKIKAEGHIDAANPGSSYLNVTLEYPEKEDVGMYTCVMYYLDSVMILQTVEASGNLTWQEATTEKQDAVIRKIIKDITSLDQRVTALEKASHNNSDEMVQRVGRLEEIAHNLTEGMRDMAERGTPHLDNLKEQLMSLKTDLAAKSSCNTPCVKSNETSLRGSVCAFSARKMSHQYLREGATMKFDHILLDACDHGYDENSAIFTAPSNGTYVFNLSIMMRCTVCAMKAEIQANEVTLAELAIRNDNHMDQSSVSAVTFLKVGDRVKVVAHDASVANFNVFKDHFTVFSGYRLD